MGRDFINQKTMQPFYEVSIVKSEKGNDVVLLTLKDEDGKRTDYYGVNAVKIAFKYYNVFSN